MPCFRIATAAAADAAASITTYTTWMITVTISTAAAAAATFGRGIIDPLKETTVLRINSVGEGVKIR